MPRKRQAFVHVGLDDGSGDVVGTALDSHAHALLDLGVRRPAEPAEGDGTWAGLRRDAGRGRDTVVLSRPLLAAAPPDRARTLVAALDAFDVHVVVTARAPDAWTIPGDPGRDLASVLDRWAAAVPDPGRLHVIVGSDGAGTWRSFGRVVGFGTASLRVGPETPSVTSGQDVVPAARAADLRRLAGTWADLLASSPYDVVGDLAALEPDLRCADSVDDLTAALDLARHEVELLRRRADDLERQLAKSEKKKRKLKRRLSEVA
ncbi:hypothetical protein FE634_19830 [Nocardioides dongxiaopingii]|uniref:hypothetical protein n=1 Tax=Nocardioides TaxID=1839 RepID=UPI0010C76660|nr:MULTISPECIES: hypothetical protein [Nocardioides]QCW52101.1 hypothetical protein FE634_19830 [Nocardioides sp. S-1144]